MTATIKFISHIVVDLTKKYFLKKFFLQKNHFPDFPFPLTLFSLHNHFSICPFQMSRPIFRKTRKELDCLRGGNSFLLFSGPCDTSGVPIIITFRSFRISAQIGISYSSHSVFLRLLCVQSHSNDHLRALGDKKQ